ncbi:NUDIX domain-containing protein [Candidatus Kaiserbacteria bacterium]|nr:NUDIX domain-containing protein [Candidatus Kaiserbacteria bacterium]
MESRRQRASAVILQGDKILLIRRIKPDRDYYIFPGGGADEGEEVEMALAREVKEELNLDVIKYKFIFSIKNLSIPSHITTHKGNRDEHYFLIEAHSGIPEISGPEKERMNEQNQYHIVWLGLNEIKKMENVYPREGTRKLIDFLRAGQ